jgi:hypothetical protein
VAFREGLGRLYNIGTAVLPVDINTSDAATGQRISMAGASGITVVAITLAGGADDLTFDIQQHTAYTGGSSADLDAVGVAGSRGIDHYYIKAETALDNDEAWVKVSQAVASEVTVVGATYGTQQKLVAIEVSAEQLAPGYSWISCNVACVTSTSQLLAVLYIVHDLAVQRAPVNLGNLLRPGAANA